MNPRLKRFLIGDGLWHPRRTFRDYLNAFLLWPFIGATVVTFSALLDEHNVVRAGRALMIAACCVILMKERALMILTAFVFLCGRALVGLVISPQWKLVAVMVPLVCGVVGLWWWLERQARPAKGTQVWIKDLDDLRVADLVVGLSGLVLGALAIRFFAGK